MKLRGGVWVSDDSDANALAAEIKASTATQVNSQLRKKASGKFRAKKHKASAPH